MRDTWLTSLRVAPIRVGETSRFDAELDEHHWLGYRMVGETMRYAAVDATGEWVALIGFASPALSWGPRDRFIGWSPELQLRRPRFVASNQRFCIPPAGRRQNAASAVMSRSLRRLSADWVESWGHPVLLVETFVWSPCTTYRDNIWTIRHHTVPFTFLWKVMLERSTRVDLFGDRAAPGHL